jgi:MFS family permease
MKRHFAGLWRHPDFMKLWVGETISLFGSQITFLALPLTAVLVLNASPFEMGLLGALEFMPFLLLSLFAGVWVDRRPRRQILITANIGRALLLATLPLAGWLGFLNMPVLYIVAVGVGVLTVFFDVAYQSYLPALVQREQLVEGNSKLEASRSIAQIAGPAAAGALVQALTAPIAVAVDAVSFLLSALSLAQIRAAEPAPAREQQKPIWHEIGEGLRLVLGRPTLRSIAACTGTSNFFGNVSGAVITIYAVRELGLEAGTLGLIFAVGSIGALIGALGARQIAARLGVGPTIVGSALVLGLGGLLIPLASGPLAVAISLLTLGFFVGNFANPIYNITQVSLRQAITPDRLQGRMNASMRFLVWGTIPLGALVGGSLGTLLGVYPTLVIAAIGGLIPFLWVLFSPVRRLREYPDPVSDTAMPDQSPASSAAG